MVGRWIKELCHVRWVDQSCVMLGGWIKEKCHGRQVD